MRAVSLFSGIGGFDLGLERAGIEILLQVEIDEFCRRVLAKHWPDVRRIADVRDVTAEDCDGADLIFGGFPCQPVSVAGRRLGAEDERWLWPEFSRLVRDVRPRYVLVENVPGLVSRGLDEVLGDLAAFGYDAEWDCVPAGLLGAAHLRERLFLVAYASAPRRSLFPRDWAGSGVLPRGEWWPATPLDSSRGAVAWLERTGLREPPLQRTADGIPNRVERLAGLGNAVVPQVAELIGRRLVAVGEVSQ